MVNVTSLFSQLLHHFPRTEFASRVKKHKAERYAKGFDCWTQFVAMLFCQMARADSLREICNGMACCEGKLGVSQRMTAEMVAEQVAKGGASRYLQAQCAL